MCPASFWRARQRKKAIFLFSAIVEMVRDGSTIRAFVLPTFEYVTVMMTGIKCPMFKIDGDKQTPEPFAEEAKFFTESRLLQREIQIVFEGNFCLCLYKASKACWQGVLLMLLLLLLLLLLLGYSNSSVFGVHITDMRFCFGHFGHVARPITNR